MNLKDKIKSALDSAKIVAQNALEGKNLTVSDEVFNKRINCCKGCEYYNSSLNQCGNCGCFLAVKAKLSDMKCPCGKWEE